MKGGKVNVTVHIPDDLASRLTAAGGDLSRRALEALAAEEYKHDRLTKPELQSLLGIETSFQLDEFLKAHDVWIEYTTEDAERERRSLERLGFKCAWSWLIPAPFFTSCRSVRSTSCRDCLERCSSATPCTRNSAILRLPRWFVNGSPGF